MTGSRILWYGLQSTLAVCLLVASCLTVVDCWDLSKVAHNTNMHEILPRSPQDEVCYDGGSCLNGGTCIYDLYFGIEFCSCPITHTGQYCEVINPCLTVRCPESHICLSILGAGPHCLCLAGITGPDCVIDNDGSNTCANNDPCQNGGTCDDISEHGVKVCWCPPGYEGLYCEKAITSSLPCNDRHTQCANGGTCEQYESNYYCRCTTEYFGTNCTESIFYPLCLDFCEHGGSCFIDKSAPQCACTPSWEGIQCSVPKTRMTTEATAAIDPRCLNYCKNDGSCYIDASGPRCTCTLGWNGRQCSVPSSLTTTKTAVLDCTLQCGDHGDCQVKSNGDRYCRCKSGWHGDKCQNKDDIAPDTSASGSSVGAVIGGSGGVLLLIIILVAIVLMISVTRARNRRREQSHSQAVGYSRSVVSDPSFGNVNGGFVHAQATPNQSPLPAKNMYGSSQATGSNGPRRYTQNTFQNQYSAKEPGVARNPAASAYHYAYGAAPPPRKTSRSSVPPESHEYAYANGDYETYRTPAATGQPPPYSSAPSIAASVAPSTAASAEHTYQSLSEYGDTGPNNKQ